MDLAPSFSKVLARLAEAQPDRPAITLGDRTVTRRELELRSNRLARAYEALGVKRDDFVAVALPNCIEFFEACIAVWKLGATPQPVSYRLPRLELQGLVELGNPALVVGRDPGEFPDRACVPIGYEPDAGLSDGPLPDRVAKHWKAVPSGGSTGRPKLIVTSKPSRLEAALPTLLRMEPERVHLVPGPLYHNGPFMASMFALLLGNHIVVLPRFDALEALEALARWRVDWVLLVPTMMHRIWRLEPEVRERFDLSALRIVLHLAAPISPWLKQAWIEWLGPERIHELYGGTEAQLFTWITGEEWLAHHGSVGRVVTPGRIRILDEHGEEVPPGTVGEVYMRPDEGPGTTYHYLGAEAKRRGEWESLGDLGHVDAEGFLYLSDRLNDMILSGGANIYPAEVEAALDSHPAVRSSCVIGLPDEDLGARTHAIVDCIAPVEVEALRAHVSEHLAPYKVPRSFEVVQEPLRDDAGKVRRSALRKDRLERMAAGWVPGAPRPAAAH